MLLRNTEVDAIMDILDGTQASSKSEETWGSGATRVLRITWTHLNIVGLAIALGTICGIFSLWWMRPQFAATAQVVIENREVKVASGGSLLSSINADQYVMDTQVEMFKSSVIAAAVIRKLKLRLNEEPSQGAPGIHRATVDNRDSLPSPRDIEAFSRRLRVERKGLTYIIDVTFSDQDAQRAADVANAVAEEYLREQRVGKSEVIKRGNIWLLERIKELRQEAADADKRVKEFRVQHDMMGAVLENWNGALGLLELEHAEYAKQLINARNRVVESESLGKPTDAEIARTQVAALEKGQEAIKARLAEQEQVALGLLALERDANAIASIYSNFLGRLKETEAQDDLQVADARIIAPALPPVQPAYPKTRLVIGIGMLGGLIIGLIVAFWKEAWHRGFHRH